MINFVILEKHSLVLTRAEYPGRSAYSLEEAAELSGVHPDMVRYYVRLGILGEGSLRPGVEPIFDDDALYELRRIEHYRRNYGVNRSALPLISRLLRDAARLEAELRSRREP
jgi:DNA-binding transcriptional MerR regulator